jgi:hypothetical protein
MRRIGKYVIMNRIKEITKWMKQEEESMIIGLQST